MRICSSITSRPLRLACLALLFPFGAHPPAPAQTRHVVIIYDERIDLPGLAALDAGLVENLRSSLGPIEVYREQMDLSRVGSPDYLLRLRDHLRAKYADKKISAAVAVMGPALDFLLAHGDVVFPATPIVFCGIDRRELGVRTLPPHVTGVLVKREFLPTLRLARALHPGFSVVFVGGASEFDRRLIEQARAEFQGLRDELEITYLVGLPFQDLLAALAKLPPRTIVLYSTIFKDGVGEAFVPHEAAERVTAASNAPVYAFLDQYIGRGVVGGWVYSLGEHGQAVAKLTLEILQGASPAALPLVDVSSTVAMFDGRQLERWKIDASALPAGSVVRFRTPTLVDTYAGYVIGGGALVLLQMLLIVGLLIQRSRRRRAESDLRLSEERYREVVESQTELISRYTRDGTLTFVNPAYCRYFGKTREQLIGSSLLDLVPATDRDLVMAMIARLAETRKPTTVEHRVVASDGSVRWQQWVDDVIVASDGSITEFQGIGRDITQLKEIEGSLRENETALRQSYERIRQLAGGLISAQEEERTRIARDLHDDLGQRIASFSIALSRTKRELPAGATAAASSLTDLQAQLTQIASDLRGLSHDLHPSALEHLGLLQALRSRCSEFTEETSVPVRLEISDAWRDVPGKVALCLYRVLQEALHNVAAHARARSVTVSLDRLDDRLVMRVSDDGRGFDPKAKLSPSGIGLVSLEERVHVLGGSLEVVAAPDAGTQIAVTLTSGEIHAPHGAAR